MPNYGRFKVLCKDQYGYARNFKASGTTVHKPLGSGAEFASNYDCLLWEEGGTLIPKKSRLAQGLRRAYFQLRKQYGDEAELPLYREGNLYNIYLKQTGNPVKLDALELNAKDGKDKKELDERLAGEDPAESSEQLFMRQALEKAPRL